MKKVHRMFFSALRERSNSDWMFQSVRFANIYIFFGISMKLTFLMQAPCLKRKYRKNCKYCPGHSLIVQSLTLYVRKMGRLQLETQNFILIILESSDETRFCVSHEGLSNGLGTFGLTWYMFENKTKNMFLIWRGSNVLEPRLQYNGARAPIYWSHQFFFPIRQ